MTCTNATEILLCVLLITFLKNRVIEFIFDILVYFLLVNAIVKIV